MAQDHSQPQRGRLAPRLSQSAFHSDNRDLTQHHQGSQGLGNRSLSPPGASPSRGLRISLGTFHSSDVTATLQERRREDMLGLGGSGNPHLQPLNAQISKELLRKTQEAQQAVDQYQYHIKAAENARQHLQQAAQSQRELHSMLCGAEQVQLRQRMQAQPPRLEPSAELEPAYLLRDDSELGQEETPLDVEAKEVIGARDSGPQPPDQGLPVRIDSRITTSSQAELFTSEITKAGRVAIFGDEPEHGRPEAAPLSPKLAQAPLGGRRKIKPGKALTALLAGRGEQQAEGGAAATGQAQAAPVGAQACGVAPDSESLRQSEDGSSLQEGYPMKCSVKNTFLDFDDKNGDVGEDADVERLRSKAFHTSPMLAS